MIIGTVAYLAPEQVEHGRTDTRTDVYAAGVLLWELLTGTPPYASDSPLTVAFRHVHEDVPPPGQVVDGVPASLDELVVRATRRDPAARPVDAGAFLAELRAVRADVDPAGPDRPVVPRQAVHPTLVQPRAAGSRRRDRLPGRGRRRTVTALLAVLAAAALAGGWYLAVGRYTAAPDVDGLAASAAVGRLERAGLEVEQRPAVFSDEVPEGHVVDQDPQPQGRVREGGTVALVVSRGPASREVPVLRGRTQAQAAAALDGVGLSVGRVVQEFSEVPKGEVVRTSPSAGVSLPVGTRVVVVLSKGVELLPVPDVRGRPRAEAEATLTEAGFRPQVTEGFSESVRKGRVAGQDPSSGRIARGASVAVQVSKGPELVTVPDVVGDSRDDAEATLAARGLDVRVIAIPGPGRVRSSDPGAGTEVRKGSRVTLYVF